MSNLQKVLDDLQPYVIGIRYADGIPLVDCIFKEGWTLPESELVSKAKASEEMNYYMIFSEKDGIGLDDLLEYAATVIKVNIEREKKHELLKQKVNELKEVFKKNSLSRLKSLKFTFSNDELIPDINDLTLEDSPPKIENKTGEPIQMENPLETEAHFDATTKQENTDDESEMELEEARAENYKRYQESLKKNKQVNNIKNKVELPPKTTQVATLEKCDCGPNEACNKCIETKDL